MYQLYVNKTFYFSLFLKGERVRLAAREPHCLGSTIYRDAVRIWRYCFPVTVILSKATPLYPDMSAAWTSNLKSMSEPCTKGLARLRQRLYLVGKPQVHGWSEYRDWRQRSMLGMGLHLGPFFKQESILPAQTRWFPGSPRQTSGIWRVYVFPVTQQRVNSPGLVMLHWPFTMLGELK